MSLENLLARTSRTFALAIPLLPDGLSAEVGLSYLLFRVADTLEDADLWSTTQRAQALADYAQLLEREPCAFDWLTDPPTMNTDYVELLARVNEVIAALALVPPKKREIILDHVLRTTRGMREWTLRGHNVRTLDDLRQYCYVVAGIVGELLTHLFDHPKEKELLALAPSFGEGLQLVNVLKDRAVDDSAGRHLLPATVPIQDVFATARRDLDQADRYLALLDGAHPGIVAFCTLPVRLARASLDRIEQGGAGAKLTREEVAEILLGVRALQST
jgi:farnesyl-diphosphate farnesyltransferase